MIIPGGAPQYPSSWDISRLSTTSVRRFTTMFHLLYMSMIRAHSSALFTVVVPMPRWPSGVTVNRVAPAAARFSAWLLFVPTIIPAPDPKTPVSWAMTRASTVPVRTDSFALTPPRTSTTRCQPSAFSGLAVPTPTCPVTDSVPCSAAAPDATERSAAGSAAGPGSRTPAYCRFARSTVTAPRPSSASWASVTGGVGAVHCAPGNSRTTTGRSSHRVFCALP